MGRRMTPADRFYEWLLSDHPQAAAERARRRAAWQARQAHGRAILAGFIARNQGDPAAPESIRGLVTTARWLLDRQAQRQAADAALSEAERLARMRADFELERRTSGMPGYRYPARYLGPRAARQPIPPDPSKPNHEGSIVSERLMILGILAVLLLVAAIVHRSNGRRLLVVLAEWAVVAVLAVLLAGMPLGTPAPHKAGSGPDRAGTTVNVQTLSDLPGKVRDWLREQRQALGDKSARRHDPAAGAKTREAGR
jgi:hypothetical protein